MTSLAKAELLKEFEMLRVVEMSDSEIQREKIFTENSIDSMRLEGINGTDYGNIIMCELARGEISDEDANIAIRQAPLEQVLRVNSKLDRLKELGLTWRDLLS